MKRYDSVCTVCGARDFRPFGQRTDGIHVLQCAACGHGIVEHFQVNVEGLYEDEYFSSVPGSAIGYTDYTVAQEQGVAWAASLLRILKPGGKVLDIGCADGRALQLLGKGYNCFGIELNDSMAEKAARSGVRIIARDLLDNSVERRFAGWFDAVLAVAVFEHIPDFKEAFRTSAALLKPNGILIFEVPLVQFAGDIWYRSSLEHLHYPTKSSIEYLFREILHLPLTGSIIDVWDFGGTYVGVTSPDAETARRVGHEYVRLTTCDPAMLHGDEARFRWQLDLLHAAHSHPAILTLYRHLKAEDWTAASLHRLFGLWAYREEKLKRIEAYLLEVERAKSWLAGQIQSWQQVAEQRQEALAACEANRTSLEEQIQDWQQSAEEQRQRIADLESKKLTVERQLEDLTRLEQDLFSRHETINKVEESLTRLESRADNLRTELERCRKSSDDHAQRIGEFEIAKTWLAQEIDNWRSVACQRSERIEVLEETIARMRGTRAWRAAEWWVRLWQKISGFFRGILLLGSLGLASSGAKNLLLGLRLACGGSAGRAMWRSHFDAGYYRSAYPDVARSGISPRLHYLLCGYLENRNPSARFDSANYRMQYADVRDAGINPLLHYALFGRREQRIPALRLTPSVANIPSPAPLQDRRQRALFATETAPLANRGIPLVSFVIPCFNYGQYVEQAILSALSQTFTNLEVIVVEGGSTDGTTPEVLRALEQKRFPRTRFVYRTESHMVGDNRNFGIGLARGRYICCLDADDLIKPNYIEIAVFLAEFFGYDVVFPSVRCFGESDFCWLLCDPTWPEIAVGNQISTVAMFRRATWEQIGGFRDWGKGEKHVPEDWDWWVRLVGHGFRAKSIREPLMLYRVHGSGLWSSCGMTVEHQRQTIREANPQLFVDGLATGTPSIERPVPCWEDLIEPAGSQTPILIALPFITIGGAEKVFETLARSLTQRGHKVVVITTLVLAETIRDCTETFEAVTPYLYALPKVLQNQEDRWLNFLFYLLKRHQIGIILIAGCDFVYHSLPEVVREFPQIAILDQLFNDEIHYDTNRRYATYIDSTLVPSQKLADRLISECGEQPDKVSVIPHGIVIEEKRAANPTFDSSELPENFRDKFLVSFFGRLSAEKAPLDFVEIANRLRAHGEICFLMTGEGQERARVLALIKRYGLQDRIHVPGFVDDVRTLMGLSDVVVVPSSLDGMPLVVFEAQACGKPVVASAVGSIPFVIADGETGLLCAPGDVNGFADRILKLWRSPELRRSIGDAAGIYVRANHSAESMTERYVEAFDGARSRARGTVATDCTDE